MLSIGVYVRLVSTLRALRLSKFYRRTVLFHRAGDVLGAWSLTAHEYHFVHLISPDLKAGFSGAVSIRRTALLPLIYTNTNAAGIFIVACLIWLIPEMIGMFHQMAKVSRQAVWVQDRGSLAVLIGMQWTGLVLNFFFAKLLPAAAILWQRKALFVVGVIFILLGVALRWYAIGQLGGYFTRDVAVSVDQPVVQQGPYRLIRHPAYSGTFLTMLGVGLATTNIASLISLLFCVFLGHFYRVMIEEKALVQTIGLPYVEYMRRTKRFIPRVF